jgi:formate-dependent nitrite reductase membrane component NrfD
VGLHRRGFRDALWSFLYGRDTRYEAPEPGTAAEVPAAAHRARGGPLRSPVQGPVIKPAVWTWEIPLYFWFGGIAAGASFTGLACDAVRDHRAAAIARRVALGAAAPCAPLLIADLGRPARFLNMLRIFKPRSPMSMGAWCLTAFSGLAALAVAADLRGRPRLARVLGTAEATLGAYLGSYTGVLLASTAVPLWARSRVLLGPIFVSTATATGAAATRLALVATGVREGDPARQAIGVVETGAIAAELVLSTVNQRRLGEAGRPLSAGAPGRLFKLAKGAVLSGLALRLARRPGNPATQHAASALFLAGGLAFRYAWIAAGRASAADHQAVAQDARRAT